MIKHEINTKKLMCILCKEFLLLRVQVKATADYKLQTLFSVSMARASTHNQYDIYMIRINISYEINECIDNCLARVTCQCSSSDY